ncbi:pilus assembly protein PilM [Clostridium sp. MSJ-11]|uniref:Pilus assembly protein PilM n=1 Tax=Clostridium mobile TaxID=2841512 RepID=A0ABS6EK03_9CLOT|nr:pilus assembly protein PilM [Clostridium mobile]MBU5485345.1 pilus assembly protein PilM [Clostridium mobile]
MPNKKLVFRFNEDSVDIVLMEYKFNKAIMDKYKTLIIKNGDNSSYKDEVTIKDSKDFIEKAEMSRKKAIAILALDGVITRLVEAPYMKKKELQSFIKNNINEYFTVNMQDYYYDYRVVEISKDKVKKFSVLLAVIPKNILDDINEYLSSLGVNVEKITIYPECLANLANKKEESSIAIVDLVKDVNNITILEGNKLFLHSNSHFDSNVEENYDEILDNIGYFLNFYSTRHFGNRVDKIYVLGSLFENKGFIEELKNQIDIPMEFGIRSLCEKAFAKEEVNLELFSDVFGCNFNGIDFRKALKLNKNKEEADNNKIYIALSSILLAITIGWVVSFNYLLSMKIASYNTEGLEGRIKSLEDVKKEHISLKDQKALYEKNKEAIEKINSDGVDHIYYLNELTKGLPSNIVVNDIYIDKENVRLKVDIKDSTLDKINLYVAINNMDIFEHVEIDSMKLDDTENEASLELKIKEKTKNP